MAGGHTATGGGGAFKYAVGKAPNSQMPKVEITIPEHLEMQIAQLVEKGEFVDRKEAVEELLSTGLKAYKTSGPMDEEEPGFEDEGMMGHEDEYVF
jgi:Arc/MetJ-type ribon-helix-helix transcriptional regulator